MRARGIGEDQYSIRAVSPKEMPSYLAAGDIGMSFIKRCFSKLASSPTKNGEYLACGLPIIVNSGIGDSDRLIEETPAAILIEDFKDPDFDSAWAAIQKVVDEPGIKAKARAAAEKLFDVNTVGAERYTTLYQRLLHN